MEGGNMKSELIGSYQKFCELRKEASINGILDLSGVCWMYPTTLLPLGEFIQANKGKVKITMPTDPSVRSYISTMTAGPSQLPVTKSYIPIVKLPHVQDDVEKSLQNMYEKFKQGDTIGGRSAFKLVIHELVGNIYEHSRSTTSFVAAQAYPAKKYVELCLFDNGITIPGNFRQYGVPVENDTHAIMEALKGRSTKSQERGKGLGSSMKILTKGLKGEALIVSAAGMVSIEEAGLRGFILSNLYKLQGTLISARIPFPAKQKVNIYEGYLE